MPSKQVLNRQIQVLENALIELSKAHNKIVNDINIKIRCEDCRKVMIEHVNQRNREFDKLSAMILGEFTHIDYSAEPYNLFPKNLNENKEESNE